MNINIWVTNTCNLTCKYCYEKIKNDVMMSPVLADSVITYINEIEKNDEIHVINFHGGEPLLNYEIIKQIVLSLAGKNIIYSTTTNGILITEEIATFMANYDFQISISIDGNQKNHDLNRVYYDNSGSYNDVIKGLKILKNHIDKVRIRMTVSHNTLSSLYDNILSIYNLGLYNVVPVLNILEEWNEPHIENFINSMKNILSYNMENHISNNAIFTHFQNKKINGECDGLRSSIHIDTKGDIYPCSYTVGNEKYFAGNIFGIINTSVRKHIDLLSKIDNTDCIGCSRYNYCAGTRCKIINELQCGNPHIPYKLFCINENIYYHLNQLYINY